jgi:hypothetical protein
LFDDGPKNPSCSSSLISAPSCSLGFFFSSFFLVLFLVESTLEDSSLSFDFFGEKKMSLNLILQNFVTKLEFKCLIFSTPFNVESCLMMTQKNLSCSLGFSIFSHHQATFGIEKCSMMVKKDSNCDWGQIFSLSFFFFPFFLVGCRHLVVPELELGCDGKKRPNLSLVVQFSTIELKPDIFSSSLSNFRHQELFEYGGNKPKLHLGSKIGPK